MAIPQSQDPGLGTRYSRPTKRLINQCGDFNITRKGARYSPRDLYLTLVNMSWQRFVFTVFAFYISINLLFALCYYLIGAEHLQGTPANATTGESYLYAFFFSVQTFTTVGFGHISPIGVPANTLAAFEAMFGLFAFSIGTGLLYGRFSRPTTRMQFSNRAIIAPLNGTNTLQVRLANMRNNNMLDTEARFLLVLTEKTAENEYMRRFYNLKLQVSQIQFFTLSWTLVHFIDENSPLYQRSLEELAELDAELMVSIQGFDDTFGQTVHARTSYLHNEIIWGARYRKTFFTDETGEVILDLSKISDIEDAVLNEDMPGASIQPPMVPMKA